MRGGGEGFDAVSPPILRLIELLVGRLDELFRRTVAQATTGGDAKAARNERFDSLRVRYA